MQNVQETINIYIYRTSAAESRNRNSDLFTKAKFPKKWIEEKELGEEPEAETRGWRRRSWQTNTKWSMKPAHATPLQATASIGMLNIQSSPFSFPQHAQCRKICKYICVYVYATFHIYILIRISSSVLIFWFLSLFYQRLRRKSIWEIVVWLIWYCCASFAHGFACHSTLLRPIIRLHVEYGHLSTRVFSWHLSIFCPMNFYHVSKSAWWHTFRMGFLWCRGWLNMFCIQQTGPHPN